jgi:UDP-N-acetylglucosamine 2-epimerase
VTLLFGDGPAALSAASVVVRAARILVRAGAGRRDGAQSDSARAVDRIASMLLTEDEAARQTAEREGLPGLLVHVGDPLEADGVERVIHALRQARLRGLDH